MNELVSKNTVRLHPDGYIEIALRGDQDYQGTESSAKECRKIAEELEIHNNRVLGLIDFTGVHGFNTGSNKAAMEAMSNIMYQRLALFGSSKVLVEVAQLITKALGKDDQTRVFHTREEAVAWLLMKEPLPFK